MFDALVASTMGADVQSEVALAIVEQRLHGKGFAVLPLINAAHEARYRAMLREKGCSFVRIRGFELNKLWVVLLAAGGMSMSDAMQIACADRLDAALYVGGDRRVFMIAFPAVIELGTWDPERIVVALREAWNAPHLRLTYPPNTDVELENARAWNHAHVSDRQRAELMAEVTERREARRVALESTR